MNPPNTSTQIRQGSRRVYPCGTLPGFVLYPTDGTRVTERQRIRHPFCSQANTESLISRLRTSVNYQDHPSPVMTLSVHNIATQDDSEEFIFSLIRSYLCNLGQFALPIVLVVGLPIHSSHRVDQVRPSQPVFKSTKSCWPSSLKLQLVRKYCPLVNDIL